MKIEFLNRIETEKGSVVKVVFTVPVGNSEVFALEKGKSYEIELHEPKLPGVSPSPKEMLIELQRLASELMEHIKEDEQPVLEPPCDKDATGEGKCATCDAWIMGALQENVPIPLGWCRKHQEEQPIYHWCSHWTNRTEEEAQ